MKKLLYAGFALLIFGAMGLAQVSGSWTGKLTLLPNPALEETTLELSYPFAGWEVKSISDFDKTGFISQEFAFTGAFGFVDVEGSLTFSPADRTLRKLSYTVPDEWTGFGYDFTITDSNWVIPGPHFREASLKASTEFAGVALEAEVSLTLNKVLEVPVGDIVGYQLLLGFPPYLIVDDDWIMQPHPLFAPVLDMKSCYNKYELTYANAGLVAKKVTFSGEDLNGNPVSHTITGQFEVYHYDAATGTVILTLGAEIYLWQYINHYGSEHDWDLTTVEISVDPDDVEAYVLFPTYMLYTFTATVDPVSVEVSFDDVSTGIQFRDATITLAGLSLCCDVSYDVELHFTKCEGFDYIKFAVANLFELCCGIAFGVDVEFGVDYKKVTPKFSWGGLEACVEVWGDLQGLDEGVGVGGWELYGFKLYCELGDCTYIEFVEAFNVVEVEEIIGDVFEAAKAENEYLKLGFCGPACCGGTWGVDTTVFFSTEQSTLFGITRFLVETEVPLMDALTVGFDFEYNVPDAETTVSFDWSFNF